MNTGQILHSNCKGWSRNYTWCFFSNYLPNAQHSYCIV